MGTVYLKQQYEKILLRHYDVKVSSALEAAVRQMLIEDGLLTEDGDYTPEGGTEPRDNADEEL